MSEQLGFLNNENLQFILFGGKGGVGKTTSSAATAAYMARNMPDKKILVFSTDPAHSLSDSFECRIGDNITRIKGFKNLLALEMDAKKVHEEFKKKHQVDMFVLADRASRFNRDVLLSLFSFSLPGLDELMAIIKIIDLLKSEEYDLIILDTAPTGHTLGLLTLPDIMLNQVEVMDNTQEMYRYTRRRFEGRYIKDESDEFLEQLEKDVKGVKSILNNHKVTEFVPVTIPEAMSVMETEDLLRALNKYEISVKHIIINGVIPKARCGLCSSKRLEQERYIKEISSEFPLKSVIKIPYFPHEVRGVKKLAEFAELLFEKEYRFGKVQPGLHSRTVSSRTVRGIKSAPPELSENIRFIIFGGKGGVGKTTCSAATAIHLAKNGKRVLVFSTDPAHSLSDSLGFGVSEKVTPVKGFKSLYGFEINPKKTFDKFKKQYTEEVNTVFDAIEGRRRGIDLSFDRRTISDLIKLVPPGLDELMALAKILEFKEEERYEQIILDTAPTGHLFRLLELPDLVIEWFDTFIKILRKHQGEEHVAETLRLLLETKKKVIETRKILTDAGKTEFVAVTIPEAMAMADLERLLRHLKHLKIPVRRMVVNRVIPRTECSFCAPKREEQQNYIKEINERFPEYAISEMPLFPYEIRGLDGLTNFAETMYGKRYVSSYT